MGNWSRCCCCRCRSSTQQQRRTPASGEHPPRCALCRCENFFQEGARKSRTTRVEEEERVKIRKRRGSERREEKGGGGGAFFSPLFFLSLREFEPFPRALSSPSASSSHRQLFLTSNARTAPPGLRHQRAATAALGLPRGGQGEREGIGGGEGNGRRQCAACLFCLSPRRCCCSRFFDSCALHSSSSRSWCLLGARRPARQARRDQAKANWGRSSTSGDERRRRACKCSFFPPRRRPAELFLRSEAAFRRGLVPGRRSRSSRNQRRRDDCQCR